MFRLSRTRNLCKLDTFIRVYQCVVRYIYMYRDFRQQQLNYVRCIAAMWLIGNVFVQTPSGGRVSLLCLPNRTSGRLIVAVRLVVLCVTFAGLL